MTGSAQVQMAAQVQLAKLENVKDVKDVKVVKLVKLGEAKVHRVDQDRLTKPRALALQQELLNTFTAPKFQKKLNEIARKHSKSEERNSAYTSFRQLVRRSQREIIPRYGFDASEEGVECMMKAFRQLKDDPDIYVNECAIKEALSLDYGQFRSQSHDSEMSAQMSPMRQTLSELSETALLPRSAVQSGSIRNLVILWLRRLIIRFSTPTFQAYRSLKGFRLNDFTGPKGLPLDPKTSKTLKEQLAKVEVEVSESAAGDCEDLSAVHPPGAHDIGDIDGYCRLLAWADGKSEGVEGVGQVRMMIKEVCILDEEVAQLFNTMNMKLGMAADACKPFRASLRLHLIQANTT